MAEQVPSVGRVVHYVSASGACRPALIIDARDHTDDGTIDLYVMQYSAEGGAKQAIQVKHDEGYKDHFTWHWPEYVPAKGV
jgi:hypothetical protein